jgi:hypothetical protein
MEINELLEVVSQFQIRFKGPAKRDYISDLKKSRYASSVRPIGKVVFLSIHDGLVCEHLPEDCAAP